MASTFVKLVGLTINGLSYISKSYAADKALSLFSKPRNGQITKIQSDFLNTSIKKVLYYNSNEIMTYQWSGNKQTVLLVHGWESNSGRWEPLINHLKDKNYNIICLDAPAHGNSGSPYFNAILFAEFINEAAKTFKPDIIIGHSVGGMATVFFQHKYRLNSLKKLVLLGTPSEFTNVLKQYTDMLNYNQRIINQIDAIVLERFGALPESFSTASYIKTIHLKGLIIHDEDDDIIPYNDALLIKKNYKNSELITTKGLGHSLNDKTVTLHVSEFLEH